MKHLLIGLFCLTSLTLSHAQTTRTVTNIDADWKFYRSNGNDSTMEDLSQVVFRTLNLPHDWSIEGEYSQSNPTGRGGGYLPAGLGWYQKDLFLPTTEAGKRLFIQFDGVMANSEVWINGQSLGKRPYGYLPFVYELTDKVRLGTNNQLIVRVDNRLQPASRWYAGAGIYRHVSLISLNPVHLEPWGVFVTTPQVSSEKAVADMEATVVNQSTKSEKLQVQTWITGPDGKTISSTVANLTLNAGQSASCHQQAIILKPALWDIRQPQLYTAKTIVRSGKNIVDELSTSFGIRDFRFEAATGFWLNGRNLKLYGVCLHQDGGPIGIAVPSSVWKTRLEKLRELGVNAIRTAHNPMDQAFYDLCDQLGFLVMDETFDTWTAAKPNGTQGYNLYFNDWWATDLRTMIVRDRNHPSVVLYSAGNEIRDRLNTDEGRQRFLQQRDLIRRFDPTRPITMALFRPNDMQVYTNGFAELLDVVGQNYRENELLAAWKDKPTRKVIGTENGHDNNTWLALRDNAFLSGQFLWTGIDYLGEANWPAISRNSGLLDRIGGILPNGYQRQSWWTDQPMVKMVRSEDNMGKGLLVRDWTPGDFGTYDEAYVSVYSNCDEVELFLNGESKGRQTIHQDASARLWNIGFDPGTLKAVAYNKGVIVATDELHTAEPAVKIQLTSDHKSLKNEWEDLAYLRATVVDAKGERNPTFNPKLTFTISGPGVIKAVDNGDVLSLVRYATNVRTAFRGEAVALIQATGTGTITVSVQAEGLEGSSIRLEAK